MPDAAELLRRAPLFQGMTDRAVDAIAAETREVTFAAGEPLMRQGEEGGEFFIVVDGSVAVSRNGSPVGRLVAGDFFGEIALIDGRSRSATVTALEPGRAIVIDRASFLRLMDSHGAVRLGVLMALTERIRRDEDEGTIDPSVERTQPVG